MRIPQKDPLDTLMSYTWGPRLASSVPQALGSGSRTNGCQVSVCSVGSTSPAPVRMHLRRTRMPPGTKKAQSKKPKKQAPALTVRLWSKWLNWLLHAAGPKIYFAIFLTGALGLRCSEALTLKREDIKLDNDAPKITVTGDAVGPKIAGRRLRSEAACESHPQVPPRRHHGGKGKTP